MKVDVKHFAEYCSEAQLAVQHLMEKVVIPIFELERFAALEDKKQQELKKGKICDVRPSRWCNTSGKGGKLLSADGSVKRSFENEYRNLSLMDHSLSVAHGAVAFTALRLASDNVNPDQLKRLCFTIGLIGFFHDVNKRAGARKLTCESVKDVLGEYYKKLDLSLLLEQYGSETLSPDDLLQLICFVESGSSASTGISTLPRELIYCAENYIRLSDNLDSIWSRLSNDKRPWGIEGVLQHLSKMADLLPTPFKNWHHIHLFNPHTPLLLDELLRRISSRCKELSGFPPLLETHHDGRLDMLVPETIAQQVIKEGLDSVLELLQPQTTIVMSPAKKPTIKGVIPENVDVLLQYMKDNPDCVSDLLPFHRDDFELLTSDAWLTGVYTPTGHKPKQGKTFSLRVPDENNPAFEAAALAATLRLLLSLAGGSAKTYLPQPTRQTQLLDFAKQALNRRTIPACDTISLQTGLAVYLANQMFSAEIAEETRQELWELMQRWYEGDRTQRGIQACLMGSLDNRREVSAIQQLRQLLEGHVLGADSKGTFPQQTCLITGLPGQGRIDAADQLYGIKASAFSTRRGRPAVLGNAKGHTFVSDIGFVEYQLRARDQRSAKGDLPLLVSSPTMTGLFAGLRLKNDDFLSLGFYDLTRETLSKGDVMVGPEIFERRVRLARYEAFPVRLEDQIDFMRRMVNAVKRTGRPIHVFRGLPTSRPEILYMDCLPPTLKKLLGGKSGFALEDMPHLSKQLNMARTLMRCCSQGHSLLRDILCEHPFGGLSVAMMSIEDRIQANSKKNKITENNAFRKGQALLADRIQEARQSMSKSEKTLLLFAEKAATLQKAFNLESSRREQQLVLRLCLDSAKGCLVDSIEDRDSLVRAIEGTLENKVLSERYGGSKDYRNTDALSSCEDIALFFVDHIWFGQLQGKPPSRRLNKTMTDIYRMEMLHIYKNRCNSRKAQETQPEV